MSRRISVWVDKFVAGWSGAEGTQPQVHPVVGVMDAMVRVYETDAHFVPYYLVGEDGTVYPDCPRLKVETLPHLADYGVRPVFDVAVADIDCPEAHGGGTTPQQWRDEMWQRAARCCPDACIYETRGGLRIVVGLPQQMDVREYQAWSKRWRQWLRDQGLDRVDEISAWAQCYRLPDVVRDGKRQTGLRSSFCEPVPFVFRDVPQAPQPAVDNGIEAPDPRQPFKLPRRIPEGQRHQTLVRYAAQLRWQGLEEQAIRDQLAAVNADRCRPAAPDEEISEIASWASQQESEQQTREREQRERRVAIGADVGEEEDEDADPFALGDHTELARRLIAKISSESPVEMVSDRNEIWRYDNGCWRVVQNHALEKMVHGFSGVDVRTHQPNGQVVWRPMKINDNTVTGAVKSVHRLLAQPQFFDQAPAGIALGDCWVRVSKQGVERLPHAPEQKATVSYGFNWTDEEPDTFYAMMDDYWGHKEACEDYKRIVLEFIGACLCGIATDYQQCIVLRGRGSNGKSSMLKVVVGVFPKDAVTSVSAQQFGNETHRAMLAGSRLNVVGELPEKKIRQEAAAALKALVSGDEIVAKWLYKDPFRFKPVAGHIVACNALPEVEDDSDGLFRRFLIIDFDKQFAPTGESRNVGDEVLALERDRIVCAALRAVPDLIARGKYLQPKESVDEVTAWRHGQDEISQFLEDCTEPCEAVRGNGTDGNMLFTAYVAWAPQNGYVVMNKNRFLNMVDKRRRKFYDNAAAKRMYPVNLRK